MRGSGKTKSTDEFLGCFHLEFCQISTSKTQQDKTRLRISRDKNPYYMTLIHTKEIALQTRVLNWEQQDREIQKSCIIKKNIN